MEIKLFLERVINIIMVISFRFCNIEKKQLFHVLHEVDSDSIQKEKLLFEAFSFHKFVFIFFLNFQTTS